jgi:hypothetical protein
MPLRRALPLAILALLLLALAAPARAVDRSGPQIVLAHADPAGWVELFVTCPAGPAADLSVAIDGGPPAPPQSVDQSYAPPALAIIVERGPGMVAAGTPKSTSGADALGQAEALLSRLPAGSLVTAVAYGERAELLAPLSGDRAGSQVALERSLADLPAALPAPGTLAEAIRVAMAQLRAAPPGPQTLVILAADGPGQAEPLPKPDEHPVPITLVGLSAAGESSLQAVAESLGASYLPYHSKSPDLLPGLRDALSTRYAATTAPANLLRLVVTPQTLPHGRHHLALAGCGGSDSTWVSTEAPPLGWQLPALAGAGGLVLGLLVGRLSRRAGGRGEEAGGRRQEAGDGHGIDGPTERIARRPMRADRATYRLVVWAGERRLIHELRERQCVIGRSPGCDLQIDDPLVSELHARLSLAGDQVTLVDLASRSGTSLGPGGPQLTAHQPTQLQDGDEFWLGPQVRVALRRSDRAG